MNNDINFFEHSNYNEFSNFYPANRKPVPIFHLHLDGREWLTTEHYFQCMKFASGPTAKSHDFAEILYITNTPSKVASLAKQPPKPWRMSSKVSPGVDDRIMADVIIEYSRVTAPMRTDWNIHRLFVMRKAVLAKFTQNENLRDLLLSTGSRMILEDSPDAYWGTGGFGRYGPGENMLGKILMETRVLLGGEDYTDETDDDEEEEERPPLNDFVVGRQANRQTLPNIHSRASNLIVNATTGGMLTIGAAPLPTDIKKVRKRYDIVIDLRSDVKTMVGAYHVPIPNGKTLPTHALRKLATQILDAINTGKLVYLNCEGGFGRTGTVALVVLSMQFNITIRRALRIFRESLSCRKDISCNTCPEPNSLQLRAANAAADVNLSASDVRQLYPTQTLNVWQRERK